jgi:hypothetical protein
MFYSVQIRMDADAILVVLGVHLLASCMPFEGVAQHKTVRTPTLMQICRCEAANLCKSGELFFFTSRATSFENRNSTTVDFQQFKKCWCTIV